VGCVSDSPRPFKCLKASAPVASEAQEQSAKCGDTPREPRCHRRILISFKLDIRTRVGLKRVYVKKRVLAASLFWG